MKFISRSSNYMLVLKPGVQGNAITGTPAVPGLYIRFRDGIAEVKDNDVINLIRQSDGFKNGDFVAVDDHGGDPFKDERTQLEPAHIITEMKYGHAESRKVSEVPTKLPASVKKVIEAEAKKMAKEMLPGLLREAIKEMSAAAASSKTASNSPKVDKTEDEN